MQQATLGIDASIAHESKREKRLRKVVEKTADANRPPTNGALLGIMFEGTNSFVLSFAVAGDSILGAQISGFVIRCAQYRYRL